MKVRAFEPADAPAWVALNNLTLKRRNTVEGLLADDARRDPTQVIHRWVIEEAGELVGGAALYSWAFDPPKFLHSSVFVHPAWRNQGVGRTLWQTLRSAAQGSAGLVADLSDDDSASLAWAERRGFGKHTHRFASELDLTTFDEAPHLDALERAEAQGVRFTDLADADEERLERYLNFVADRLTETPDLAGLPRWSLAQVREMMRLETDPRPDWFVLAVTPTDEWLGLSAMIRFKHLNMAYNELTATHPTARGRGLALPLKLHVIRKAKAEGLTVMRTNNHSQNAPMLAVNRKLGFVPQVGKFEMHLQL